METALVGFEMTCKQGRRRDMDIMKSVSGFGLPVLSQVVSRRRLGQRCKEVMRFGNFRTVNITFTPEGSRG